ncbi:TBC1 domain family member 14-like isoform X1 [Haliotis asinina]|uniref:TBC1 domain family member 14-like isoform X1 n=1 Tax=Haliotis asinina TaxID=109174 RepID=UPI003531AEB7
MSTMGKTAGPVSERMKLKGMCEEGEDRIEMRQTQEENDGSVTTINLFDTYEDVDKLKSRVQGLPNERSEASDTKEHADDIGALDCDLKENGSVDVLHNTYDKESDASHSISSSDTILCSESVDGQNCSQESNATVLNGNSEDYSTTIGESTETSAAQPKSAIDQNGHIPCQDQNKKAPKGIMSGLVMSPITLTQDVPVSVGSTSNTNRLSRVLESMPLPLLYIPTTKQLVAGQNSSDSNKFSKSQINDGESVVGNEDSVCNGSQEGSVNGSDVKEAGTPDESDGSASYCPDSLTVREADQITLHSVDCLLPHVSSGDSVMRGYTDVSSLSSISTGTDFSISAASLGEEYGESKSISLDMEDGGFMDVNLHSRNSYERCRNVSQDSGIEDKGGKSKRKTFSGFLSRNLFSRKAKENASSESAPGWKLFGRIPPKAATEKDPVQISTDYQAKQRASAHFPASRTTKKQDIEVLSTTALILENRPMNLPSKNPEEAEKHRQEYEAMVEAARRKEQKEMKQKKRQLQQQLRQEDQLVAAARIWNNEVLPNWDTMKGSKKARDLWWIGLPPNVRGKVWRLALGNDLNITQELYEICVSRAEDRIKLMQESASESSGATEVSNEPPSNKEDSVTVIKLDVSRTFPQLCIFQKGGPYHDLLHSLLGAYACYRPDVGYVQGMSFIAAILLLNMDVADAFVCFANLLNRPCQVTFFRMDEAMMMAYYDTFTEFFRENLPHLHDHFVDQALTPNLYLLDWIFLIYGKSLPLDVACRVWDVFCRDGEEFLFRTALGILRLYEGILINMDFIHLAQFLTKLPEDISADNLFRNIDTIRMNSDKKKFAQVLSIHRESREDSS